ncbi:MAG: DUF6682 family protein [Candidatus Micrarchaeaceae archaeon]
MTTLVSLRTRLRSLLDETTALFWTDAQLTEWLNDGCSDLARRAEIIETINSTIAALVNTSTYALPANCLRVTSIEYLNAGITYPITPTTRSNVNRMFGGGMSASIPLYFIVFGLMGSATIPAQFTVYPPPSLAGTFNIYYYASPTPMVADSDIAQIPNGWEELPVVYAQFKAMQKNQDPTWQAIAQLYESKVHELISVTRDLTDRQIKSLQGQPAQQDVGRLAAGQQPPG